MKGADMLEPNRNYVIEEDGSIHKMLFSGDADWEEKATTSIQEIRNKAIDEFVIKLKRVRGYGLITNFDRPFGVTFNKLDEIAEQLKGGVT